MISFRLILGVLYGLLVIAIAVLAIATYQNDRATRDTAYRVKHTQGLIELTGEIGQLYEKIQLESGVLAVSVDSSTLRSYRLAKTELGDLLERLKTLTAENAGQQVRIDTLEKNLARMIRYADDAIADPSPPTSLEKSLNIRLRNAAIRSRAQAALDEIKNEEKRLLAQQELAYTESIGSYNWKYALLLGGIGFLLIASFLTVRYNFNRRIHAQQEQEKALGLFHKLFEESPVAGLISRATDMTVINYNAKYAELVNNDRSGIVGRVPVFLGSLNNDQRAEMDRAIAANSSLHDVELEFSPKTGESRWVSISMLPIQIEDEQCLRYSLQDLTAHKRAETDIKAALATEMELNKMKSDFVTLASHEFRTPLTSIITSTSLLETVPTPETERLNKHLSRIKSSVNTLTSILNEFLSVAKIEDGRVDPKLENINLKDCLEKVCGSLKPFAKPGQTIACSHEGHAEALLDRSLLEVIISNLASNALKYSPAGTPVEIMTSMNSNLEMVVKDSGIGIPVQDQKNLFGRFYRSSNSGNVPGTGLGLYIVKHYVEKLNGSIQVSSFPGKGTEFRVFFRECGAKAAT